MANPNDVPSASVARQTQQLLAQRELESLIDIFYAQRRQLATFVARDSSQLPIEYQQLLAHTAHMTVTVERRHGCSVSVEVLNSKREDDHYCREILLRRQRDDRVVQFGIVRMLEKSVAADVLAEILAERTPLGRVLIGHEIMTQVDLLGLWRVECGERLSGLMGLELGRETYGRTALIYCDGEAAIELLEIVAPEECFADES